jgi:hypothetical protein
MSSVHKLVFPGTKCYSAYFGVFHKYFEDWNNEENIV